MYFQFITASHHPLLLSAWLLCSFLYSVGHLKQFGFMVSSLKNLNDHHILLTDVPASDFKLFRSVAYPYTTIGQIPIGFGQVQPYARLQGFSSPTSTAPMIPLNWPSLINQINPS